MSLNILFSKNPLIRSIRAKSISDYIDRYIESATDLNIATGFISNESIAELRRIIEYRKHELSLSLFIGMNYIDGFTRLQYEAVRELGVLLTQYEIGNVYVSPNIKFHGKMYSFMKNNECLGAFLGSSNLGSFIGSKQNYIEADVFFSGIVGCEIDSQIKQITENLGVPINNADKITEFKAPPVGLLDGYEHVTKLTKKELAARLNQRSSCIIRVPLKTQPRSNLNSYFGAGKIKGRFSRRDYYEVELIISKSLPNIEYLPSKEDGPFTVVTNDGYMFECSRQGDYSKNFRSAFDLRILGKWIKGQLENFGALKLGELVTDEVLRKFGKKELVLTRSIDGRFWIMELM